MVRLMNLNLTESVSPASVRVTQANLLVEASYRLNLEEKRIIIAAIAKIDSRKTVPDSITITAEEYAKLFDLDVNAAYQQLKEAAVALYDRTIKLNTKDSKNRPIDDEMRWVYRRAVYHSREGKVTIKFSPDLIPYLGQLKEQFTGYKLANVKALKSIYSIRLYELLTQYLPAGERWISVDQFRDMLDLNDKYPRFADLKRWIIEPAIAELNTKSNYDVRYEVEKSGNKISKLWFYFSEKSQLSMDF
jgi:plasmid replication initiation protein